MHGFIHTKNWLEGQVLLRVFITLFILTVFVPELTPASRGIPARTSICHYRQNYALLPVTSPAGDDLCRVKRHDGDTPRRTISIDSAVVSFRTNPFIPHPDAIPTYVNCLNSIFGTGFRQACQRLDLPPPSASVSAAIQNPI